VRYIALSFRNRLILGQAGQDQSMSALPPKADIPQREMHVRFGPERAPAQLDGYALEKLDQLNG
jgi:hypothetical protein